MTDKSKLSLAQWTENLAKEELPAITSIAALLDNFANDDISSIPKLSKVILHDQALSSCLLRVANSSHRSPVKKVTTVSRAAIVLGIQSVKNICLTAKILDGLLKSKNLAPEVYDRLMMLMANAFYAGLLARIMVPNYDENTQEEVYLAAMLYHIGETSFWSTGSELTEKLIKKVDLPADEFQKYCRSIIGVRFKDLSIGLARTWNLGDMLVKSLDKPESRTVEMKIISLSNQLTAAISSPPKEKETFDQLLNDVGEIMNTDVRHVKKHVAATRKFALELLQSYGATALESYIKPLPKSSDFAPTSERSAKTLMTREQALLQTVKELTGFVRKSANINELLAYTLKHSAQILEFDRCTFWVLSADKSHIETRTSFDIEGDAVIFNRSYPVAGGMNVMSHVLKQEKALLINDFTHLKWRNYITQDIEKLINKGAIAIAPVMIGEKSIGLVSAQFFEKSKVIDEEVFAQFSFLVEHLNMCLSLVSQRA